jgi:hypothetical protein
MWVEKQLFIGTFCPVRDKRSSKKSFSTQRSCLKSQNKQESGHPEFISGSDIQCDGILKQVQDNGINDF